MKSIIDWCQSWWVTYVGMSRRERRALIEIINDQDAEYVEIHRPE